MSRTTSYGLTPGPHRIEMVESIRGTGPEVLDAMQSLLDNMERRCAELRQEISRKRNERL